jgi:hypothetical protein
LIQNVAFGSRDLEFSNNDTVKVPAVQRRLLRERMWDLYEREHTDGDGHYSGVSRSVFLQGTNLATSTDQKSLAALDNHSVRYGSENFRDLRDLITRIAGSTPAHAVVCATLTAEVVAVENFFKYDFEGHLTLHSTCANHCLTHAFGGAGGSLSSNCPPSCGGHLERCAQCDRLPLLFKNIEALLIQVSVRACVRCVQLYVWTTVFSLGVIPVAFLQGTLFCCCRQNHQTSHHRRNPHQLFHLQPHHHLEQLHPRHLQRRTCRER